MTYRFELLPEAMLDVEEAFLWYNAVSSQLSESFQAQLIISFVLFVFFVTLVAEYF